jgi:Flp pilus assembly protein TadG
MTRPHRGRLGHNAGVRYVFSPQYVSRTAQLVHARCKRRRRWSAQPGQSLVELAAALVLFASLLTGAIELGRLAYMYMTLVSAARAGVQYGAESNTTAIDNSGMQTAAQNDATNITGMTATASHFCKCSDGTTSTCAAGDCSTSTMVVYVQVVSTDTFTTIVRYPILPSSISLSATAILRVSQ